MLSPRAGALFLNYCLLVLLSPICSSALSWGFDRSHHGKVNRAQPASTSYATSHVIPQESQVSSVFSMALNELQALESEPLCHRIAARLLVNNCHLLDGQDEATVHLDSGRAARDFVDSYAASLAICDLERGSFVIPSSCFKFREATLAALPVPKQPHLHVSTPEIDSCLEGLAQSDSAWNTWVSYRHKALRFCEVARAENEKDQSIHVSQQVTRILENLTSQVATELSGKMRSLNRIVRDAANSADSFAAGVDRLGVELGTVMARLQQTMDESNASAEGGLEAAKGLQQALSLLLRRTLDTTAEIVASHNIALQDISQTATHDLESLTGALFATLASSASLQHQMDAAQIKTEDMLQTQARIEAGMEKLEDIADDLLSKFGNHEGRLGQAQQKAERILDTLEAATASATNFKHSVFGGLSLSAVWPYIVCPTASLVMGSYRLEPSITRNLWLVGIGEVAGFVLSTARHYASIFFPTPTKEPPRRDILNTSLETTSFSNNHEADTGNQHLRRDLHSPHGENIRDMNIF